MHLDLVHGRRHVGLAVDPAQVGRLEVGDADGADPAAGVDLLHRLPGLDEVANGGQRPVHEEQVEVPEVEVLQRLVEGGQRVVVRVEAVVELAGDEDVVAVDAGGADGLADLLLVSVHLGGVDVPVADLEGRERRVLGLLRVDLEHPEAELRDLDAVVEGDVRYGGHACSFALRDGSSIVVPNTLTMTLRSGCDVSNTGRMHTLRLLAATAALGLLAGCAGTSPERASAGIS